MNILIIEDEQPAREKLRAILFELDQSIRIAGMLESTQQVEKWFRDQGPDELDLIISDIQLLDGDVFEVFMQIEIPVPIIFLTAYNQYMMEAFRSKGIAYITKPYTRDEVANALKKYDSLRDSMTKSEYRNMARLLRQTADGNQYAERLMSRKNQKVIVVEVKNVVYFQINEGVITAVDEHGKQYPLSISTLGELEDKLNPLQFYRINRGEIININYVDHFEPFYKDRLSIAMSGINKSLITSNSRAPGFRNWLAGD